MKLKLKKNLILTSLLAMTLSACGTKPLDMTPPPAYYAPENYVLIDGVKICYLKKGEGKPLLLIHGFTGNAYNWMDVFFPLSERYTVIVPDLPGCGRSGCDINDKYTIPRYAEIMVKLLDELKIEKASVAGNSMGGHIALWMAIHYPEYVEKLILCDSAGIRKEPFYMKMFIPLANPSIILPFWRTFMPVTEEGLKKIPESEALRTKLAEQNYDSSNKDCIAKAMSTSIKSIGKDSVSKELDKIKMDCLIIWGEDDDLLPVKTAYIFQKKIPGSKVSIIQGGRHTPMQWKPDEFIKEINEFLSE